MAGAIILITSDEGLQLTQDIHLYSFFGCVLLFGGFVLSMRSLMLEFRRDGQIQPSPLHRHGAASELARA
ncbi:hypothetical protein [Brevibacterium permense]|uniref:hypothetical protein n=1 Tax=Brevibacterium permense TaxID=234834 RepID=UPI0021D0729F|nr:hypothetical protein [Brevibacterium permense]